MTDIAEGFGVSKTIVSDDVEAVDSAFRDEGLGFITVDRGRSGGASFIPSINPEERASTLNGIAETLSEPGRFMPGGLIFYSDLLMDPRYASFIGAAMATDFCGKKPDVVMTSEMKGIPIAIFTAFYLGVPLAVCRFINRPGDGSAVALHYPTRTGTGVRTMYLGTRQMKRTSRVLIVDDFMKGGSTTAGMLLMAEEFDSSVVGVGVFIACEEPKAKAVSDYRALLTLTEEEGKPFLRTF